MNCRVCSGGARYLFTKTVLSKYEVKYYQCQNCLFIETEEPYWLEEAYSNVITSLDIGLVQRNSHYAPIVHSIIKKFFNTEKSFLDFGGGYGMLVRMMRDRGLNFYRQDKFCDNLFAKHFDIEDIKQKQEFEIVTAFELFEHLVDPIQGIEEMLSHSKSILFSTELSPDNDVSAWWYLVPEVGQHVSLYHLKTLEYIANKFSLNLYSNRFNTHLMTSKKINPWVFRQLCSHKVSLLYSLLPPKKETLLHKDFYSIKSKLDF